MGHTDTEQAQILRHMLGIDKPEARVPVPYRDYYCASRGDTVLAAMAAAGLVECYRRDEHYDWYTTTEAGRTLAFRSHRASRNPKAKRVYLRFLSISDVYPGLTFREFLTRPEFADARRHA